MNPLLMVWNLEGVAVKQFTYFYNEILMVLESPGSCREAMIDGLDSPGCYWEAIDTFPIKYKYFIRNVCKWFHSSLLEIKKHQCFI